MRNVPGEKRLPVLLVLFCPLLALVSCASPLNSNRSSMPTSSGVAIDWVNFIQFGGITYLAANANVGRPLTRSDLGPVFATVAFKLEGNVQASTYRSKDGDAAFLDAGTQVYRVKGYSPTFRLAAFENRTLMLYEADTNPHARKGGDLLDIGGKVRYIGIVSDQDGITELGAIKNPPQIAALTALVLDAPADQSRAGGDQRYFLVFHLVDGTTVKRTYWLDTGELERGILLPKTFGQAIEAALTK